MRGELRHGEIRHGEIRHGEIRHGEIRHGEIRQSGSRRAWKTLRKVGICTLLLSCSGPEGSAADSAALETGDLEQPLVGKRTTVVSSLFGRENMVHGIAAADRVIFVTEPLNGRVLVHDGVTGRELGEVPPPPGGFLLPFALRIVEEGRLVVLDAGGFPNPGTLTVPRVYDYDYTRHGRNVTLELARSVVFDGIPVGFTEDVEVLDNGTYVVSDSILGALWLITPEGNIEPGVVPAAPDQPVPALTPCLFTGTPEPVDGIPFALIGNFAPGVGSMATDGQHYLYYGNSCSNGVFRIPLDALFDTARPPEQRADGAVNFSPGAPGRFEVMKGLSINRWDRRDKRLYVLEPLALRLIRIDPETGAREVLATDGTLFNFPVASSFMPSSHGFQTLVVSSDQEHRFAAINQGISEDMFEPPFLVTRVRIKDWE